MVVQQRLLQTWLLIQIVIVFVPVLYQLYLPTRLGVVQLMVVFLYQNIRVGHFMKIVLMELLGTTQKKLILIWALVIILFLLEIKPPK